MTSIGVGDTAASTACACGSEPLPLASLPSASLPSVSLAARRSAIGTCRAALAGLRAVLVACADRDLGVLAGELAEVRALAGAGLAAVTAEAETRGVIAASQCASTAGWVADAAWHSRREASVIAKTAALLRNPELEPIADAVGTGDVDLSSAVACGRQYAKLAPDLTDVAKPIVLEQLLDIGAEHGPVGIRRLTDEILARYGSEGTFDEVCERRRRHIELSAGRHTEAGMWQYLLTLDGEGRAVLEAAIGPGSAPKPADIEGRGGAAPSSFVGSALPAISADGSHDSAAEDSAPEVGSPTTAWANTMSSGLLAAARDTRPVGRRRGEALIDALRRSTANVAFGQPPVSPKAIVMLTMDYEDLTRQVATRLDSYRYYGGSHLDPPGGSMPASGPDGGRGMPAGGPAGSSTQESGPAGGSTQNSGSANSSTRGCRPASGSMQNSGPASSSTRGCRPASGSTQESGPAGRSTRDSRPAGGSTQESGPAGRSTRDSRPAGGGTQDSGPASSRTGRETHGAATVLGSLAAGELISPAVVRRIACDAAIIPVVLNRDGEILDQGRTARLFTPGQVRAHWRRDRRCTFPDCDIPAAWCDAHHLTHWADGGTTSLSNAALLCARHHTIVHRDQLAGTVIHHDPAARSAAHEESTAAVPVRKPRPAASVSWSLRPGSYHAPRAGDVDERLTA